MNETLAQLFPYSEGGAGFTSMLGESSGGAVNLVPEDVRKRLSARIQRTLFGMNNFLMQEEGEDAFLIDSYSNDTIQVNPIEVEPIATHEARQELAVQRAEIDQLGLRDQRPEWEAAYRGMIAIAVYTEEQERLKQGEEKSRYRGYYASISGDVPELIPDEALRETKKELLDLLGLPSSASPQELREAYRSHHDGTRMTGGKSAIERYYRYIDHGLAHKQATNMGDPEMENFDYGINWRRDESGLWTCWERGLGDGFQLDMNEVRLNTWNLGTVEQYSAHEARAHFGMLHRQNKEIKGGRIDDIASILLIPDPRCWPFEAVAQTIDTFADLELSRNGQIAVALYRMYKRILTNSIFKLEDGANMDDVVKEGILYAPQKTEDGLRRELTNAVDSPMWRAYSPIYGRSDYEFMVLADNLGPAKRLQILKEPFRRAMTRDQFMDFTRKSIFEPAT